MKSVVHPIESSRKIKEGKPSLISSPFLEVKINLLQSIN